MRVRSICTILLSEMMVMIMILHFTLVYLCLSSAKTRECWCRTEWDGRVDMEVEICMGGAAHREMDDT